MSELNDKNLAHMCVYTYLRNYLFTTREFTTKKDKPGAGDQMMGELAFYPNASSPKVKKSQAHFVAVSLMDYAEYYTPKFQGDYRKMSRAGIAIAIANVIVDANKTVYELAEFLDTVYAFPGEKDDDSDRAAVVASIGRGA